MGTHPGALRRLGLFLLQNDAEQTWQARWPAPIVPEGRPTLCLTTLDSAQNDERQDREDQNAKSVAAQTQGFQFSNHFHG